MQRSHLRPTGPGAMSRQRIVSVFTKVYTSSFSFRFDICSRFNLAIFAASRASFARLASRFSRRVSP
jgi:hypothetical protein